MYNITLEDYDTLFQLQGGVCLEKIVQILDFITR